MEPTDLITLREFTHIAGASLLTVRTWKHRHPEAFVPWRKGAPGEPDLYLRTDLEAWLLRTGRMN